MSGTGAEGPGRYSDETAESLGLIDRSSDQYHAGVADGVHLGTLHYDFHRELIEQTLAELQSELAEVKRTSGRLTIAYTLGHLRGYRWAAL